MVSPVDVELMTRFLRDLWQVRKTGINERVVKNVNDWAIGSESMGGMGEVYRRLDQQKRRGNLPTAGVAGEESLT
jgi:hypothetical protein